MILLYIILYNLDVFYMFRTREFVFRNTVVYAVMVRYGMVRYVMVRYVLVR